MEKINLNININGGKDVDNLGKSMEKVAKNTNKTTDYLTNLRKELKQARSALIQAEEGTQAYNNALAKVGQISFQIRDANEKARLSIMDLGAVSQNVGRALAGVSGAFTTATGAMSLLGLESEGSLKIIQNLTSFLSITQGLVAFADTLDSVRDLFLGLKASSDAAQGSVEGFNTSVGEVAKTTANTTSNIVGMNNATDNVAKATDEFSKRQEELLEKLDNLKKAKEDGIKVDEKELLKAEMGIKLNDKKKKVMTEGTEEYKANAEAVGNLNDKLDENAKKTEKTGSAVVSTGKNILKSFGWTAVITVAIAALTFAVTKLIDELNKIPEDIKLRLKLEEETIKDVQSAEEKIAKIKYNLTLTSTKEELKLIKQKLIDEKIATEEQLKGLNDSKSFSNQAFWDAYIDNVKAVSENEYLIRRDIELRLQAELAKIRVEELRKTQTYLQGFASIFGLGSLPPAIKDLQKINKEIAIFKKTYYAVGVLKLNEVKFDLGGVKKDEKIKSPIIAQLYPNLTQKQIDAYVKDLATKTKNAVEKELKGKDKPNLKNAADLLFGDLSPEQLQTRFDKLDAKRQLYLESQRDAFEQQMSLYQSYANSLATLTDAFSSLYDARLTTLDNYYTREAELVANSTLTEEEKNKKLNRLETERYKKQKELFERQKKWQVASVLLNLFSGLMNIYTSATLPVTMGGLPRPGNWIAAGLEATALSATSLPQIQNIQAQQLNGGGSTSGASITTPQINSVSPNKLAMKSSEELLNKINSESEQAIVKVSEINKVQSRVKVSELNSNY